MEGVVGKLDALRKLHRPAGNLEHCDCRGRRIGEILTLHVDAELYVCVQCADFDALPQAEFGALQFFPFEFMVLWPELHRRRIFDAHKLESRRVFFASLFVM